MNFGEKINVLEAGDPMKSLILFLTVFGSFNLSAMATTAVPDCSKFVADYLSIAANHISARAEQFEREVKRFKYFDGSKFKFRFQQRGLGFVDVDVDAKTCRVVSVANEI
jgi:hypothetical protein